MIKKLTTWISLGLASMSLATGNPYDVNLSNLQQFGAGSGSIAQFRMFLPDPQTEARYVLLLTPGFNGDGREMTTDSAWVEFARKNGCAIVATFFQGNNPPYQIARNWSGRATLSALQQFAQDSGHPEIAKIPWLLWGHSAGGQFNYNLTNWRPDQIVAFVLNKSGFLSESPQGGSLQVPGLFFAGETDTDGRLDGIATAFARGRRQGAPWCFVMEMGSGHEQGRTVEMAQAFFDAVLSRRANPDIPTWEGTLSDHSIRLFDPQKSDQSLTSWLPDEATAKLWQKLVTGNQ